MPQESSGFLKWAVCGRVSNVSTKRKGGEEDHKNCSANASVRGCLGKQRGPYVVLEHQQCTGVGAA